MKNWGVSIGGLEKMEGQSIATHLWCEEMPWYAFFAEHYLTQLCCLPLFYWAGKKYTLHDIPLPSWPTWEETDPDFDREQTNLKDTWGDVGSIITYTWSDFWYHFAWKHTKHWSIPVAWEVLKPHQSATTIEWVEKELKTRAEEEKSNEVVV